jgi:hypothetical protein
MSIGSLDFCKYTCNIKSNHNVAYRNLKSVSMGLQRNFILILYSQKLFDSSYLSCKYTHKIVPGDYCAIDQLIMLLM